MSNWTVISLRYEFHLYMYAIHSIVRFALRGIKENHYFVVVKSYITHNLCTSENGEYVRVIMIHSADIGVNAGPSDRIAVVCIKSDLNEIGDVLTGILMFNTRVKDIDMQLNGTSLPIYVSIV
ncbi:hypothetical protein ACF0H5_004711 [Mactra antiquata]